MTRKIITLITTLWFTTTLWCRTDTSLEIQTGSYAGTLSAAQTSSISLIPLNVRYYKYLEPIFGLTAFGLSANFDYVSYSSAGAKKTGWLNAIGLGIEAVRESFMDLEVYYGGWLYPFGAMSVNSKSRGEINGAQVTHTSILTLSSGIGYELFAALYTAFSKGFFSSQNRLQIGLGLSYFNMNFSKKSDQTLSSSRKVVAKDTKNVSYKLKTTGLAFIVGLTL